MAVKTGKGRKITWWTRIGFGCGGFIGGGGLTFAHSWLLLYYTTFCGLDAWKGALIFSLATWFDVFESSIIGFISDNFYNTHLGRIFGRRRFFILICIPFFMLYPLCWVRGMSWGYYMVTYLLYDFVDNTFSVTHNTLKTEMSTNYTQRQLLSGSASVASKVVGFITAAFPLIFFSLMGKNNPNSYVMMVVTYSVVMVIAGTIVYLSTWEYSPDQVHIERTGSFWKSIWKMIKDTLSTFRSRTFRWHIAMYVAGSGGLWLMSSISTFNFIYVMKKSTTWAAGLGTIMKPFALISAIFAVWVVTKVGDTARPYIWSMFIVISSMLLYCGIWFFHWQQLAWLIGVAQMLLSFGEGIAYYVPQANYPYMPDVDVLITNRRREGIISGAQTMSGRLVRGIVTMISGSVISATGLVKGRMSQPYSVQLGLVLMMLIGVCGMELIAIFCSRHMKADEKNLAIVDKEVKRVHAGGKMEDVDPHVKEVCELLTGFDYKNLFGHNNVGYKDHEVEPAKGHINNH